MVCKMKSELVFWLIIRVIYVWLKLSMINLVCLDNLKSGVSNIVAKCFLLLEEIAEGLDLIKWLLELLKSSSLTCLMASLRIE